jgi:hypothetical protein
MIKSYRIEPVAKGVHMQALPLCYHLNQKIYYANATNFNMWSEDPNLENSSTGVKTGEKILFTNSRNKTRMFVDISFEADDKNRKLENRVAEKRKQDFVELFLSRHPLTLVNGKAHENTVDPQFNVIDTSNVHINQLTSFEEKFKVQSKIMSMTLAEKRDVCYYFGQTPKNKNGVNVGKEMTDLELNMYLSEPTSGLIVSNAENIRKFQSVFMSDSPEKEFDIMIQKAVLLNILETKTEKGSTHYYLGSTLIGATVTDVQSFFKNEPELYENHIVAVVKEKDSVKGAQEETLKQVGAINTKPVDSKAAEIHDLREEIKGFKKEGLVPMNYRSHQMPYEELVKTAQAAREKKREKELSGS